MTDENRLRSSLNTFLSTRCSGVIALCGDPEVEDGLSYMVCFPVLNIIYVVHADWGCEYFDVDCRGRLAQALDEFAARQDTHTLTELGIDETDFLRSELNSLLWHMAHDESEAPSNFNMDRLVFRDPSYTLFGSGDLEMDLEQFHRDAPAGRGDWRNRYARLRFR